MKSLYKRILVFIFFCTCLECFASGGVEFNYSAGEIDKVVSKTEEAVSGVRDLSNNYVIKKTKSINSLMQKAKDALESDKRLLWGLNSDEKKLDSYLKSLKNIVDFYSDILKNEKKVRKDLLSYYSTVEGLEHNLTVIYANEKAELRALETELESVKYKRSNLDTVYDIQIESLIHQISYCKQRIEMIENFNAKYSNIIPKLDELNKNIDTFFITINESYKVYKAAYDTCKLSRDINAAYGTIIELKDLDKLSVDIQASWNDLEFIVSLLLKELDKSIVAN